MNERDQLLNKIRQLRAESEELIRRADAILDEDEDAERRWTPVVIKGGLLGVAAGWVGGRIRDALVVHPVRTAVSTFATSGVILAGMLTTTAPDLPPQARRPEPPTSEGPPPSEWTTISPTEATTSSTPADTSAGRGASPILESIGSVVATTTSIQPPTGTTTRPPTTGAPTTTTTSGRPAGQLCAVELAVLDLLDVCLLGGDGSAAPRPD